MTFYTGTQFPEEYRNDAFAGEHGSWNRARRTGYKVIHVPTPGGKATAQITVRFVSQLVSVTHDRAGAVIDGSPDKVTEVTDVWTFARDLSVRDPNWKLVATEAGQ